MYDVCKGWGRELTNIPYLVTNSTTILNKGGEGGSKVCERYMCWSPLLGRRTSIAVTTSVTEGASAFVWGELLHVGELDDDNDDDDGGGDAAAADANKYEYIIHLH